MTLILLILAADLLKLRKSLSNLLMVLISAVLFSLYHYLGAEPFNCEVLCFEQWREFILRVIFDPRIWYNCRLPHCL